MMSTAHTPTTVLLAPRKAWLGKKCWSVGVSSKLPLEELPCPGMGVDGSVGVPSTSPTSPSSSLLLSSHSSFGLSHYTHNVRILPTPTPMTGPLAPGGLAIAKSQPHTGCCREGLASTGGSAAVCNTQWSCSSNTASSLIGWTFLRTTLHSGARSTPWFMLLCGVRVATIPSRTGHEQPATRDCHPFPRTPTLQTQPTLCILPPPGNHNPTPNPPPKQKKKKKRKYHAMVHTNMHAYSTRKRKVLCCSVPCRNFLWSFKCTAMCLNSGVSSCRGYKVVPVAFLSFVIS